MQNPFQLQDEELKRKASELRVDVLTMLHHAKSGHTGGSLGMADVFTSLYFNILRYDPKDPQNDERDRLVLSNGHICPILYVAMAHAGFFDKEELMTLRQIDSRLQGHPHNLTLPGIENSSGPLGQGISQAVGMALRAKMDHKDYLVFCLVSDGENQEGQFWEALLFASAKKLDNLIVIVDKNNIEIDGYIQDIMPLEPLDKKYEAFNMDTYQMDGNSMDDVVYVINKAISETGNKKPKIISATTLLGAGVPFMENNYEWHGKVPSDDELREALKFFTHDQN